MGPIASQITSLTIVYSTVYSGVDQRKTSKLRVTCLFVGNSPGTGEFPAQMASNAENDSIWWRHDLFCCVCVRVQANSSNEGWQYTRKIPSSQRQTDRQTKQGDTAEHDTNKGMRKLITSCKI